MNFSMETGEHDIFQLFDIAFRVNSMNYRTRFYAMMPLILVST